jgi:glyoxylase-like metal-dependent hydrolase (beta-lactamase superfamily II)
VKKNPGLFRQAGTNTYLVGAGKRRILVDAGEGRPGYLPLLRRAMRLEGCECISDVILTHYHRDHTYGLGALRREFGDALRVHKFDPHYVAADDETSFAMLLLAYPRETLLTLVGLKPALCYDARGVLPLQDGMFQPHRSAKEPSKPTEHTQQIVRWVTHTAKLSRFECR